MTVKIKLQVNYDYLNGNDVIKNLNKNITLNFNKNLLESWDIKNDSYGYLKYKSALKSIK